MPLVEEYPAALPPDRSRKETIESTSQADGCRVKFDLYCPSPAPRGPLPLLLAPHPITWTAAEDYHGGLTGLMRKYHPGYYGLAQEYGVLIAMPHGHQHREELCSLAGPEQIADMVGLIDGLGAYGYEVDSRRVYTCGMSMGAQEALVLAGRYPDRITAAVAFNPIVDLAAWHHELATSPIPEIREFGTAARIANEVGGTPTQVPDAYARRSATNYVDALSRVPTLIFWSDQDLIIPRQVTHHTYALYQRVKEHDLGSSFGEYNHTHMHGPLELNQVTRWQLHEWCDYALALRWLLCHRR